MDPLLTLLIFCSLYPVKAKIALKRRSPTALSYKTCNVGVTCQILLPTDDWVESIRIVQQNKGKPMPLDQRNNLNHGT